MMRASAWVAETWGWIAPPPRGSLDDFGDDAGADRLAAFPDGEVAPDVEGHRLVQADGNTAALSPGMTISIPSGNCISPVTFVVLKKNCGL